MDDGRLVKAKRGLPAGKPLSIPALVKVQCSTDYKIREIR
jgi:hypothetical protein